MSRRTAQSSPSLASAERDGHVQVTYRTARVLAAIAFRPGVSNREVADAAEISDEGQASKLLARLQRLGLIENSGEWRHGERHAWRLTARGREVERGTRAQAVRPPGRTQWEDVPDGVEFR